MSNSGYDHDAPGGLMPLIRALIKPPDEEANGQKSKKPQHPYYKRPGKGHNHDSCDACGEGGDLICCDRCPASFHLGCYDPPLEENDIPAGQWLCKECRGNEVDKPPSSRSSRAQSPSDNKSDTSEKRTRILRNNRTLSSASKKKGKEEAVKQEPSEDDKLKEEKELTPMEVLVKAARIMNPRQFELPMDMRIPCPFPGTDKDPSKNGNGGVVSVDAAGCVPLPARTCFVCQFTCKQAPLLQCDYCPLLYHQDCLDPPLTALPTGRWMCPNHVEQYIDWKLVNSISATERVALWDKFSGPVDQHAIKIDFIRRARNTRPPFRQKVPVGVRGRVAVPAMVKHHYEQPPPLLPSRREYVRCRNVLKQLRAAGVYDEVEDDKKHVICMNLDCPKYTRRGGEGGVCPHDAPHRTAEETTDTLRGVSEEDARSDLRAMRAADTSDSDMEIEELMAPLKRRRLSSLHRDEDTPRRKGGAKCDKLSLVVSGEGDGDEEEEASALLSAAESQLDKLDARLVSLLAWQRLQQLLAGERCAGAWARAPLSARAERLVHRSLDRATLARHGFRHVQLPSQLLSREDHERIARRIWGLPPPSPPRAASPLTPEQSLSDATVRATLCVVERPAQSGLGDGLGRPIPMRLSRLTVGGGACDVSLRRYAACRRVSPHHATIFYDEVTRHFELINYSEWGTLVNGVLYTCDLTEPPPRGGGAAGDGAERVPALAHIADKRLWKQKRLNGSLSVSECGAAQCRCPPRPPGAAPPAAPAWEGSALVPHGALLQFGCVQLVFSITDATSFPYTSEVVDPAI